MCNLKLKFKLQLIGANSFLFYKYKFLYKFFATNDSLLEILANFYEI